MENSVPHLAEISIKQTVDYYSAQLTRDHELASQVNTSALNRLVWLTGIAGFVLLNAKPYFDTIRGKPIAGTLLLWLLVPWILTALLAIVSHVVIDEWRIKENRLYSDKKSAIDLHRIEVGVGKLNLDEFSAIIRDTDPGIKPLKEDANKWGLRARWLERSTLVMMLFAFLSLGIPLVFP